MNTGGSTDFSKAWVRFVSEWFRARIFSNNLLSAHFHLEPPLFPLLCSRKQDEISFQEIIALWCRKKLKTRSTGGRKNFTDCRKNKLLSWALFQRVHASLIYVSVSDWGLLLKDTWFFKLFLPRKILPCFTRDWDWWLTELFLVPFKSVLFRR